MSRRSSQGFWAPGGATLRLPPRMRLAPAQRDRLWKGLERFVNCGDTPEDYAGMHGWSGFWPVKVYVVNDGESTDLSWKLECHRLFLFYCNTLRRLWRKEPDAKVHGPDFLLGVTNDNAEAIDIVRRDRLAALRPQRQIPSWRGL